MSQSSPPEPTPPLSEQLADLALKVVKPGGLTVGGLGAVWFLLAESDIPKSIASAVIGVLLSYGAKLLEPIHRGNQKRFEETGTAINSAIDQGLRYLTEKAKGGTAEDRYLACQALACQQVKADGMIQYDRIFTPLLAEVFVSLSLDAASSSAGWRAAEAGLQAMQEGLKIWDFLAQTSRTPTFRQMAILAWGGSGKTTLLKHIAYCYGSRQTPRSAPPLIPFLLILRTHRDTIAQQNQPSLPDLITTQHIPHLPGADGLQMPDGWVQQVLTQGRGLVMLDGFDEVPPDQRSKLARWINQQMHRYGKSVFLVTSRPRAYTEQVAGDAEQRLELATRLWVRDFDAKQRQDFVQRWYLCQERYANGGRDTPDVRHGASQSAQDLLRQIETRDELRALAKNPLLLNLIVTFHRRNPAAQLPQRRVELYKEICQLQLKDRPAARSLETLLTQCEAQEILQPIAWEMMKQRWERIDQEGLLQGLQVVLDGRGESIAAAEFLQQVVQISELLVEQETEYEFAHLSFQEYLAASHIAQDSQARESWLYPYLKDDKWKPTILLYVAQVKNPTTMIQAALSQGFPDLAYQCLQELPATRRIAPQLAGQVAELQQTVQTSRYSKLERYLKAQDWKAADQETYRLMITTVGKEEGQWFDKEELLNFPCPELKAIDGLWVKYSQGRFGFSVQKQIYVKCGGKLDGSYPGARIWEEFGDRVGWRKNGKWLSYSDLEPSLSSHEGTFPWWGGACGGGYVGRGGIGGGMWRWLFYSLAQRLVNCSR